jgi:hypothetical protein
MKSYRAVSRLVVVILVTILSGCAQPPVHNETVDAKFMAIPLGTKGRLLDADLSSYLVSPVGDTNFIAFDAGTVLTGLQQAKQKGKMTWPLNLFCRNPVNVSFCKERIHVHTQVRRSDSKFVPQGHFLRGA